ncbi:C39 family peptidase [Candidatus Microgenomates bacterium]|nr:C39 family peptidase [Candidatus Microgenomates bacterium]
MLKKILLFPTMRQTFEWDCGAKAVQSVLAYYGIDEREEVLMKLAGTTKNGTPIKGIKKVLKKYGLDFEDHEMTIKDLKKFIKKKMPVIILLQAWAEKKHVDWSNHWESGHFAVVIGYDRKRIYFEDPASTTRTFLTYEELEKRWHDFDMGTKKYIHYGIAVHGKHPSFSFKRFIRME